MDVKLARSFAHTFVLIEIMWMWVIVITCLTPKQIFNISDQQADNGVAAGNVLKSDLSFTLTCILAWLTFLCMIAYFAAVWGELISSDKEGAFIFFFISVIVLLLAKSFYVFIDFQKRRGATADAAPDDTPIRKNLYWIFFWWTLVNLILFWVIDSSYTDIISRKQNKS